MHKNDAAENPSHDDPVAVVDSFLRRGGSVCFPALRAAMAGQINYQVLPDGANLQGPVYLALRAFMKANALAVDDPARKLACIFVDPDPAITADEQRRRAFVIQEEIHVAIARINSWTGWEAYHRAAVRKELAGNEYPGVAGPDCLGKNIIRFAMGPHYEETFRRHAPRLIVPVTTGQDAGWAADHTPEDVRQTYLAITRRSGEMLTMMAYYEDVDRT